MGCREGLEAAAPSTVKESPRRPCSGWRREKCCGWPARVPYTAGEKQLCLLTCGSPAANGWAAKGERRTRPPTASPSENEGELDLHTKPRRVVVTDLSEESTFGAGRNAFAVWPRPVTVKRLSSFQPGGQERPGLAEAAGLLGRFMLTRLHGCWREEDRPRAPQTVVGGRRVAWAPPLGGSLLGGCCSLGTEEEGVEKSLALLGMNWLRAADWVLAERNLSTTALTASPNNPDCEMGASIKNVFSFSRISVRLSHRWRSAATEAAIERPTARAVCLVALRAKSVALRSSFTASGVKPVPSSISVRTSAW